MQLLFPLSSALLRKTNFTKDLKVFIYIFVSYGKLSEQIIVKVNLKRSFRRSGFSFRMIQFEMIFRAEIFKPCNLFRKSFSCQVFHTRRINRLSFQPGRVCKVITDNLARYKKSFLCMSWELSFSFPICFL